MSKVFNFITHIQALFINLYVGHIGEDLEVIAAAVAVDGPAAAIAVDGPGIAQFRIYLYSFMSYRM